MSSWRHGGKGGGKGDGWGSRSGGGSGGGGDDHAHMGPIGLRGGRGTLTAADRDRIWQATGVSASVRWRAQWGERCLTLSGPASNLTEALRLSNEAIRQNGDGHEDGGPAGPNAGELQALREHNRTLQAEVQHIRGQMTQMGAFVTSLDTRLQETARAASETSSSVQGILHRLDKRTRNRKRKKERRRRHSPQEESEEDERGHSAQRTDEKQKEEESQEETDEKTDEKEEEEEEDRNETPEKKEEKQEEKDESSSSSSEADGGTAPQASGAAHNQMGDGGTAPEASGAAGSGMDKDQEEKGARPSTSVKEEVDTVDGKLKAAAEKLKDPRLGEKCVQTGLLDKLAPEYKRITKESLEKAAGDQKEPSQASSAPKADIISPTSVPCLIYFFDL